VVGNKVEMGRRIDAGKKASAPPKKPTAQAKEY
jgi:hypothetical protein